MAASVANEIWVYQASIAGRCFSNLIDVIPLALILVRDTWAKIYMNV
jgi:hypothetical protein